MKVIDNIDEHENRIRASIRQFGYNAEHNYMHYWYTQDVNNRNIFLDFSRGKGVLSSVEYGKNWYLFPNGILGPEEQHYDMFRKFLDYALVNQKGKKVVIEVCEPFKKIILDKLSVSKKYRALTMNYILHWPVYHMKNFDHNLKGKQWKKIRNILNRFKKKHSVRLVDAKTVHPEKLKKIIDMWVRRRNHLDAVDEEYYHRIIDHNFKGLQVAKCLMIDGEPCTLTGGWKIPNRHSHYYSSLGVVNFRHQGLSELANLYDLLHLKKKGYRYVDFGGSDYSLLNFKNKFKPDDTYKTYIFSVVRR